MREENERRVVERLSAAEQQAVDCERRRERNHVVEETNRKNRMRVHDELVAARRDEVAQVVACPPDVHEFDME